MGLIAVEVPANVVSYLSWEIMRSQQQLTLLVRGQSQNSEVIKMRDEDKEE